MKAIAWSLWALLLSSAAAQDRALTVVSHVDLARYVGKWYEIARYPNRFERACASDITAEYTQRGDGKIRVVNSCRQSDGSMRISKGTAKVVDPQSNAKLKVSFFWPFYGDYWILELAPDYSYAVVGEPTRKYLWILSRTPQMEPDIWKRLLVRIGELGYDPDRLMKPPQSGGVH